MKAVAFAFLFTLLVVAVAAQKKKCQSSDDCDDTECCLAQLLAQGFFRSGICRPLEKEGKTCNDDLHLDGQHIYRCPCAEGLTCEAKILNGHIKMNPRCVSGSGSTATHGTEAPAEE